MRRLRASAVLVLMSVASSAVLPIIVAAQSISIEVRGDSAAMKPIHSSPAAAVCTSNVLAGNWYIKFRVHSDVYYCKVAVSSDGSLALQRCDPWRYVSDGQVGHLRPEVVGTLALARSCSLSGNLTLKDHAAQIWEMSLQGAMSADKNAWMADGFIVVDEPPGKHIEIYAVRRLTR